MALLGLYITEEYVILWLAVAGIKCHVDMVSEWKPYLKTNPRAFFTAQVSNLEIDKNNIAILT